jgi:hypothetical protein
MKAIAMDFRKVNPAFRVDVVLTDNDACWSAKTYGSAESNSILILSMIPTTCEEARRYPFAARLETLNRDL